jgi:carboxymethylenebutenolidase
MMTEYVSVPAEDGRRFDALFVSAPRGRSPGLVLLSEIFGLNAEMRAAAERWAAAGYAVLAPDLFWRQQRNVALAYEGEDRARAFALYQAYDYESGVRDVAACLAALRRRPECNGKAAVVGYCFGGTLAWLAAARADAHAAISFYGTKIHQHLGEVATLRCPVALHLGDADAHVPAEAVAATRAALAGHPRATLHLYPGIGHAFMNPARPTYDRAAAELAFTRAREFLDRSLAATRA